MAASADMAQHGLFISPYTSSASRLTTTHTSTYPLPTSPSSFNLISDHHRHILFPDQYASRRINSTGKGILIGMLSAFGSALLIAIILVLVYLLRYTTRGRIFLDRIGRPGEFDDEQAFLKEEEEALDQMDDMQRSEYLRAKAFVQANPPESAQTDISLSQFLAIQEKGVSAWEFEPELEIANCFVEGRTEIEFFDSECSVQTNLPVPKQNEVYYWEAKIYDKPEATTLSIGFTTKPYPLFRLPGLHKTSVAYLSPGYRRFNQPFTPTSPYGPPYVVGDVIGVGYRPRTGTVFFTRNGRKLEDITHTLKHPNLFPTVGATGPCKVHVNFGQMGFVFIEANVKKWGLAPMTGSLAPPPPYGSEAGSILLEGGQHGVREGEGWQYGSWARQEHARTRSGQIRVARHQPRSPGPVRSPTDISLAQLSLVADEDEDEEDVEYTDDAVVLNQPQQQQHRQQQQYHSYNHHQPTYPQHQQGHHFQPTHTAPQPHHLHAHTHPRNPSDSNTSTSLVDFVGALQASEGLRALNLPPGLLDAHFTAQQAQAQGPPPPEYESPPEDSGTMVRSRAAGTGAGLGIDVEEHEHGQEEEHGQEDEEEEEEEEDIDPTPRQGTFMHAAQSRSKVVRRQGKAPLVEDAAPLLDRRGEEEQADHDEEGERGEGSEGQTSPPIPSYDAAVGRA